MTLSDSHPQALAIRAAGPQDADQLRPLLAAVGFPTYSAAIRSRLEALTTPADVVLVAVRASRVVGVVTAFVTPTLHRERPVGRVTLLSILEDAQGQGIGRALMAAVESELAARGCEQAEVISNQRFADAHKFYDRLGYELTSLKFRKHLPTQSPR